MIVRRLIREQPDAADLRGAMLEQVDLHEVDLVGAQLRGASLGGADLRGSMLEDTDLREANLRFANLEGATLEGAMLEGADLWGATLAGADLRGADLRGATAVDAVFRDANLTNTHLQGSCLRQADLAGANLAGADLAGAILTGTMLRGAALRNARLQGVDLSTSDIAHIHLSGAWLDATRLRREQLGGATGEELAGEYAGAVGSYHALERNFISLGDLDAARWAYGRRRRMQKLSTRSQAREAGAARRWGDAAQLSMDYAGDQIAEWVCDYGESVPRVLGALVALPLLFALLYGLTGSIVHVEAGVAGAPVRNPVQLIIFTLLAMTAQTPAGMAVRDQLIYFCTSIETLLGIFLTGLLGFVAGNRIRR